MWKKTIGIALALILVIAAWIPAFRQMRVLPDAHAGNIAAYAVTSQSERAAQPANKRLMAGSKRTPIFPIIAGSFISARRPVWPNTC